MKNYRAIAFLSATEVLTKLTSNELTHVDITTAIRRQIQKINPRINAYDSLAVDIVPLREGPLKGLPISVKDQIHVAGMPCNFGLDRPSSKLCENTASPIQRLQSAGVSIIGKTNLPPFAMDYLDIGADLAGTLRIPAAFCGVFSFFPSEGALASDGMLVGNGALSHFARMGPIARNIDDLMLAWRYLSATASIESACGSSKIALWEPADESIVDEQTLAAFGKLKSQLEASGFDIETTYLRSIINEDAHRCFGEIMGYETGGLLPPLVRLLGRVLGRAAARRSPKFLTHVHSGQAYNSRRYDAALEERLRIQLTFDAEFADYDAILLPVSQVGAFEHRVPSSDRNGIRDYKEPFLIGGREVGYLDSLTSFTTPISLMGNSVVTIPLGIDERGLPIGAV